MTTSNLYFVIVDRFIRYIFNYTIKNKPGLLPLIGKLTSSAVHWNQLYIFNLGHLLTIINNNENQSSFACFVNFEAN